MGSKGGSGIKVFALHMADLFEPDTVSSLLSTTRQCPQTNKICSLCASIREIQIKTSIKNYFIPIRIIISKPEINMCWRHVEIKNLVDSNWECKPGEPLEYLIQFPNETENRSRTWFQQFPCGASIWRVPKAISKIIYRHLNVIYNG